MLYIVDLLMPDTTIRLAVHSGHGSKVLPLVLTDWNKYQPTTKHLYATDFKWSEDCCGWVNADETITVEIAQAASDNSVIQI